MIDFQNARMRSPCIALYGTDAVRAYVTLDSCRLGAPIQPPPNCVSLHALRIPLRVCVGPSLMQEPDTSTNSKVPVYHGVDRCSPKVAPSSAGTAYAQNENHGISTAEDGNLSNTLCTATPHTARG